MIPQYYFRSSNSDNPLTEEIPVIPIENKSELEKGSNAGCEEESYMQRKINPNTPQLDQYTQGYLQRQIGKNVRIQFLIGTSALQDRTGILTQVGIDYVIIRNEETNALELGDLYSIRFVDVYGK